MSQSIADLEPRSLWRHFEAITRIPRPSKHEDRIVEHVLEIAGKHGFEVRRDPVGNLVLAVPATPGRESAPTVVIQGHLDMVCEKNRGTEHDFMNDPIKAQVANGWVTADGTTLGADNGIGVAAGLAAATDPDVPHGPLELLLTLDEETGLTGAQGLDASIVTGRTMLNLDSEEDGVLYVGCAGGADAHLTLPVTTATSGDGQLRCVVEVAGLRGGHSGLDIKENRGNAVKVLARALRAVVEAEVPFALETVEGGDKHNAIPREAEAVVRLAQDDTKRFREVVDGVVDGLRSELSGVDDGLKVEIVERPGDGADPLDTASRDRLLRLLAALPHGVLAMSRDLEGLVETSTNLASVKRDGRVFRMLTSSRSSVMSAIHGVLEQIRSSGQLAGANVEVRVGYPGWQPNLDSPVLSVVKSVYDAHWGRDVEVTAIHAGLECGLIGEKVPGMDMVSFGPNIEGAHSPDERVEIDSVARFWNAFRDVLDRLSKA